MKKLFFNSGFMKLFIILLTITLAFIQPSRAQGLFGDKNENKKPGKKENKSDSYFKRSYGYKTGLGHKQGPNEIGLTAKHFITNNTAIEVIFGSHLNGVAIEALYVLNKTPRLKKTLFAWEFGAGVRSGFYRYTYYKNPNYPNHDVHKLLYFNKRSKMQGVVGLLGIEYQFSQHFTLGMEIMPYYNFNLGYFDLMSNFRLLSLRYVFTNS